MPGLLAAKLEFEAAVQNNPNDPAANFFLAITRLPALMDNSATYTPGPPIENVRELLDSFGISASGRDIFHWSAKSSKDAEGKPMIPANAPSTGAIQQFLVSVLVPEIDAVLANLSVLDGNFNIILSAAETGEDHQTEIDYGDILLFRAALYALKADIYEISAYDTDVDSVKILEKINNGILDITDDLFHLYLDLLTPLPTGKSLAYSAKINTLSAIDSYMAASDFIRNETDDQSDDLITIDTEELAREARFRSSLTEVKDSITEKRIAAITSHHGSRTDRVDFNRLFGTDSLNPVNIRNFVPLFDGRGHIYQGSFPDTTLGGLLPDCTTESKLLDFLPHYLPIVFPIQEKTITMDGNETDWQGIPRIMAKYAKYTENGSNKIEYARVAKDAEYIYFMWKLQYPYTPGVILSFACFDIDGRYGFLSGTIDSSTSSYTSSGGFPYENETGTSSDYGIVGTIVEGRVPLRLSPGLSQYQAGPLRLSLGFRAWAQDPNVTDDYIDFRKILAVTVPTVVDAGPDRSVIDSVTLDGRSRFPGKNIISWNWRLTHRANNSFNRTATGANPTVSGLAPGFYDVTLTATDDTGKSYSDSMVLVVGDTTGLYTQEELNQAVLNEREKWDINGDGRIGLEEAIRALQITSGQWP